MGIWQVIPRILIGNWATISLPFGGYSTIYIPLFVCFWNFHILVAEVFFWRYSNRFVNEIQILLVKNKKHFFWFQAKAPHIDGWISHYIFPLNIHYSRYFEYISTIYIYDYIYIYIYRKDIHIYIIFMYKYTILKFTSKYLHLNIYI